MQRTGKRSHKKGIALITALIFSMFIFMVGGIFVLSIQRDFAFQTRQDAADQAYFMALSGVDFYRHQPLDYNLPNVFDVPVFTQASPGIGGVDAQRTFEVYGEDATAAGSVVVDDLGGTRTVGTLVGTHIISTGRFFSPDGTLLAERTITVPQGLMTNAYER